MMEIDNPEGQIEVPDCFKWKLSTQQTRSDPYRGSYQNLSTRDMFAHEKEFLIGEIEGKTNLLEPAPSSSSSTTEKTLAGLARRYNLNVKTVTGWKRKIESGKQLQDVQGRPSLLDYTSLEAMHAFALERQRSPHQATDAEMDLQVRKEIQATSERRGVRIFLNDVSISARALSKLYLDNGWKKKKKQRTTLARYNATRSVRAVYRYSCFYEEFSSHLPPECKHNIDATTLLVSMRGNEYVVVVDDPDADEDAGKLKNLDDGTARSAGA
jgi:transposase